MQYRANNDMSSKATALFRSSGDHSWAEKNLIGLDIDHVQSLRHSSEDTRKIADEDVVKTDVPSEFRDSGKVHA